MPFSKTLSNIANICHRLFLSSLSPQGRSVVSVWFLQTFVLPGICVWGGRWRWKCTLPAMLVRLWQFLLSQGHCCRQGSTCKILCFSPRAVLSELDCPRCGKGRQRGQSWKADPREASDSWHVFSSGTGVRGTESDYWPHVSAAALTPHRSGTDRVGSMAVVTLLPLDTRAPAQAMAKVAFLPTLWLQPLPALPGRRNWGHSSTSRVVALPSHRWM